MNLFIDMFLQQIPLKIKKIDFYTKPVSSSWGIPKLQSFCAEEFGTENLSQHGFLFMNSKRNVLRLLYVDNDSSQLLERMLIEGTFLTPVGTSDSNWVQLSRESLPAMMKVEKKSTKRR